MQEMLSPKQEKPRQAESPPVTPEATAMTSNAELAAEKQEEAGSHGLMHAYEAIEKLNQDLAIVEDVLRVPESGMSEEERHGLEESRKAMLARLKGLEKQRDEIAKQADPEEAKSLKETWARLATTRAAFEEPTAVAQQAEATPAKESLLAKLGRWTKEGGARALRRVDIIVYHVELAKKRLDLKLVQMKDMSKMSMGEVAQFRFDLSNNDTSLVQGSYSDEVNELMADDLNKIRKGYHLLSEEADRWVQKRTEEWNDEQVRTHKKK